MFAFLFLELIFSFLILFHIITFFIYLFCDY